VLGDAQDLDFANQSFDAIFMVTTLEFVENYKKAVEEATRVLAPKGKLVIMMLNPESEYFKSHMSKENSYFRRIRHTNLKGVKNYISKFFGTSEEYFLEIKNQEVFTTNKKSSALYVVKGIKK
jgi:ubiquinone/menaquinone biosynthesis C-methylase UbiE